MDDDPHKAETRTRLEISWRQDEPLTSPLYDRLHNGIKRWFPCLVAEETQ